MAVYHILVHVKKVEIFGFKSFGFKNTTVNFEPGLVSISGPNGSGKSNILDAIIFAMGENKPRVMRVDKLRSLIHDIAENRRGPRMARSSVHFDNSDRKIPVDSDNVEITREMDDQGENTYYLNKKKTTRGHVLDLLDMANAGLGQLNAVQQGTVTRISEMSSDEKRTIIENMLGLSYFDEKKDAALRQLEDADRRLEIALVKMTDIKERLEELEVERNQKLRHDMLERELARYARIDAANRLRDALDKKSAKQGQQEALAEKLSGLAGSRNAIAEELGGLKSRKSELMEHANRYTRDKEAIDTELSEAMRLHGEKDAAITTARRRIERIEADLPGIDEEVRQIAGRQADQKERMGQLSRSIEKINANRETVQAEHGRIDAERKRVLDEQSAAASRRSQIDKKMNALNAELNSAELELGRARDAKDAASEKLASNSDRLGSLTQNVADLSGSRQKLSHIIKNHRDAISTLRSRLEGLQRRKSKISADMEDLAGLLEKSSKAANQYESKIKTVKGFMHEDYTVARLKEDADALGILGIAYEMIHWDKKYDRPVLAVSSDWLKAIVVRDFATLLDVAEFARSKNLPKLKLIPLEAIPRFRLKLPGMPGVLGPLSEHVECGEGYSDLKTFLFGNVVLADSKEAALRISQSGYKSVTMSGEFFEARGGTVTVDINSKISKLTKLISMSTDIEGLFSSIRLIKRYMQKQKNSLKRLDGLIDGNAGRLSISESSLASDSETLSNLESRLESAAGIRASLESRIADLTRALSGHGSAISVQESRIESIRERIQLVQENYADGEQDRIAHELERINGSKSEIEDRRTAIMNEHSAASSELASLGSELGREESDARRLASERKSLLEEKAELESGILAHTRERQSYSDMLVRLREKEQQLIASSGSSIDDLKSYDDKIGVLSDRERGLASEINAIQRQSDSLDRDIADLARLQGELEGMLPRAGLGGIPAFDVSGMLQALESEIRSLDSLNAKAPDAYGTVYEGYRSWSPRKNSLEEERNSIVQFIEGIDRDKKQTFLDAFDKVDKEIRLIFGKMTGGNAWLELQNEDDIFSSGISYMIQFPNKPKRESSSISGGEKTLAATVFVLALQRLKPSPFYLFDEIDAHLDAPNSERLAKILGERAQESQFIMVSLKDSVVQKARLIYGVYPKNGVSNVVTYKDKRIRPDAGRT